MNFYLTIVIQLIIVTVKGNDEKGTHSKNLLPYFRRHVDEDLDKPQTSHSKDPQDHLVTFLINNIKEIFSNNDDVTEFSVTPITSQAAEILRTKNSITTIQDPKLTDVLKAYRNMSLTTEKNVHSYEFASPGYDIKQAKHSHMMLLTENNLKKSEQKLVQNHTYVLVSSLAPEPLITPDSIEPGHERSCIFCNNVRTEDCIEPKNKLISSIVCDHEGDQCYSLHTPFGIIDRGCYNVERNLTTYVCACNLCNYISMADMPYVFSTKREWVHNVVELSRSRNLRKSVFKDMACLRCEVNKTWKKRALHENDNCRDGNIGSVPTEICEPNEVCAVKAIKESGYLWRGCVRSPLYNYWWNICDEDLCNYDTLVSIYDLV